MTARDKILEFARIHGPVLPIEIAKILQTDTIIAGAHLSELVASKRMFVSHVKVGGSPVYYLPGQEYRLQQYTKNLHEKEQQTYTLLKEKRVLRDRSLDPLTRVTLRAMKDFAKPLEVDVDDNKELFWKWYLLSTQDASTIINQALGRGPLPIEKPTPFELPPKPTQNPTPNPVHNTTKQPVPIPQTLENIEKKETETKEKSLPLPNILPERLVESPQQKQPPALSPELSIPKIPEEQPQQQKLSKAPAKPQISAVKEPSPSEQGKKTDITDAFSKHVERFLTRKNITVIETQIKRKNNEVDCVVSVPSPLGSIQFYCKARNKKKIDEGDLHSVYAQGQLRKLPILLLSPGLLTKKAQTLLEKEFCGITFVPLSG
ncbi:hypothetical protein HYW21_06330 [Candidatus Woesearchaeota archaeon]|nr:hypothetical protein [Candidatus Woesearchaeota archaeon]